MKLQNNLFPFATSWFCLHIPVNDIQSRGRLIQNNNTSHKNIFYMLIRNALYQGQCLIESVGSTCNWHDLWFEFHGFFLIVQKTEVWTRSMEYFRIMTGHLFDFCNNRGRIHDRDLLIPNAFVTWNFGLLCVWFLFKLIANYACRTKLNTIIYPCINHTHKFTVDLWK